MANLSNINGKFLFTDGDFLLIGGATANSISATESGVAIKNSNAATLSLQNSATNGKNHTLWSNTDGSFNITDVGVATRFTIASGGDVYFPETLRLGIGTTSIYPQGGDTILKLYSASGGSSLYLQSANTGSATTDGSKIYIGTSDLTISNAEGETRFFNEGSIMMNISKFDGSANANPLTSSNIRIWTHSKTGWLPGDILSKIEFYSNDVSGIGARNAASIRVVNENGNGSTTTTFSGALAFYTSAYNSTEQEAMRIGSSGTVTVTNSSSAVLKLQAGTNSSASLRLINDAHDWDVNCQTNDKFAIYSHTDTTERLVILPTSGNVGIGTTSPSAALEVRGDAPTYTNSSTVFWGGTTNNDSHNGIMLSSYGDALGGSLASNLLYSNSNTPTQTNTNRSSGQIVFSNTTVASQTSYITFGGYYKGTTTFVERMRIDSSGNVGIGTISPSSTLTLGNSTDNAAELRVLRSNSSSSTYASAGTVGGTALFKGSGDVRLQAIGGLLNLNTNGSDRMRIESDGGIFFPSLGGFSVSNSDVRYNATSDELYYQTSSKRYKSEITDLENSLDKVNNLRPVRFKDNLSQEYATGMIAEEVAEIIPEVVFTKPIDGFDEPQIEGINYSDIVPFLIKSIQELKAEIEQLKTQINN